MIDVCVLTQRVVLGAGADTAVGGLVGGAAGGGSQPRAARTGGQRSRHLLWPRPLPHRAGQVQTAGGRPARTTGWGD